MTLSNIAANVLPLAPGIVRIDVCVCFNSPLASTNPRIALSNRETDTVATLVRVQDVISTTSEQ